MIDNSLLKQTISCLQPHKVLLNYEDRSLHHILIDTRLVSVGSFTRYANRLRRWRECHPNVPELLTLLSQCGDYETAIRSGVLGTIEAKHRGIIRYALYCKYLFSLARDKIVPDGHVMIIAHENIYPLIRILADEVYGPTNYVQDLITVLYGKLEYRYYAPSRDDRVLRIHHVTTSWYVTSDNYYFNIEYLWDVLGYLKLQRRLAAASNVWILEFSGQFDVPSFQIRLPWLYFIHLYAGFTREYDRCLHLQAATADALFAGTSLQRLVHVNCYAPHALQQSCTNMQARHVQYRVLNDEYKDPETFCYTE